MMKAFLIALTSFVTVFSIQAYAATPPAAHKELSTQLENGIEWGQHLRTEAKKGSKMDANHLEKEIKGTLDTLKAMQVSVNKILQEAPAEVKEGHFIEMQKFQKQAETAAEDFVKAKQEPKKNVSAMKNAAARIVKSLEDAKHWHELELSEIERNPNN